MTGERHCKPPASRKSDQDGVANRRAGHLLPAGDIILVATTRRDTELHLDEILTDHPRLDGVVADRIGYVVGGEAVLKQHAALNISSVLKAADHVALVEPRVLAAFELCSRALCHIPLGTEPATTVIVEHGTNSDFVEAFEVEKIVQVGAGEPGTLDDGGILDVSSAGCPVHIEGRYPFPPQLGFALHERPSTRPVNLKHHAHRRPFEHRIGKQGDVGDDVGESAVKIPFSENFIDLVLGEISFVLAGFLAAVRALAIRPHSRSLIW